MPRLVDVSIRIRIFAAFGLVLFVTLALGGFGLVQLSRIDDAADVVVGNSLPSVSESNAILKGVLNYRRHQAAMMLNDDPQVRAERRQRLVEMSADLAARRKAYEALITTDRDAFERFDRAWARFLPLAAEIDSLMEAGKRDEYLAIYNGPARQALEEALVALEEAVGINERDGKDGGDAIIAARESATFGTIVALLAAAGLSIEIGRAHV